MQRALRIISLALAAAACVLWLTLGANRGWTRTTVPVKTLDEVTGIEGIAYRKQFVPGLDFLGGLLVVSGMLSAVSLFIRKRPIQSNRL